MNFGDLSNLNLPLGDIAKGNMDFLKTLQLDKLDSIVKQFNDPPIPENIKTSISTWYKDLSSQPGNEELSKIDMSSITNISKFSNLLKNLPQSSIVSILTGNSKDGLLNIVGSLISNFK